MTPTFRAICDACGGEHSNADCPKLAAIVMRATPQAVSGALIAVALALSGCVFHRTTIVNVRADDHFDIRPIVGEVNVTASMEANSDH